MLQVGAGKGEFPQLGATTEATGITCSRVGAADGPILGCEIESQTCLASVAPSLLPKPYSSTLLKPGHMAADSGSHGLDTRYQAT